MHEFILPGDPPVRVLLRRSARARRFSLRVSRLDGRVTLTLPANVAERRGIAFVEEKAGWLRQRLSERTPDIPVAVGTVLTVAGQPLVVAPSSRSRIDPAAGVIAVARSSRSVPTTVAALLRGLARDRVVAASDDHSGRLGRPYARITLRDTRSRWGSCSAEGALMYSWRLILAPPGVLDYVCAHEVAHLAEMNHGPQFWATVERLRPDYGPDRSWLRRHGEDLHRFRFAADAEDRS
ncbi:M48 family metallopeptidase [Tropicimonas sp. IMCC34043]|uniref:M48 family metallopeptidase n=1 Tax=Tropicimonas sp. IMCC34043 TaxID=2248760 RepID=UPI000E279569|nr:SprT family zinc-dependent metalloprotease [Tropicimonas sp. IMCC34043]